MIDIERKELLALLEPAAKVSPTSTPADMLKCLLLKHDGEHLSVTAWDGEVGVTVRGKCKGAPCKFLLPAKQAVGTFKLWTSEHVKLTPSANDIEAQGEGERRQFPTLDPDEFPTWEFKMEQFDMPHGLTNAIKRTIQAASVEPTRHAINGVYLDLNQPCAVATDATRLAISPLPGEDRELSGVLPTKLAQAVASTIIGNAKCRMNEHKFEITDGHAVVFGVLVQGMFPQYRKVIPTDSPDAIVTATVADLVRITKQAGLANDPEEVRVRFELKNSELVVAASGSTAGAAESRLPVADAGECKVELDGQLLVSLLSPLDPHAIVEWDMRPTAANALRVGDWLGIIMPLV